MTFDDSRPYKIDEFCAANHFSRGSWYNMCKRGDAPAHYKVGKIIYITRADAAAWLEKQIAKQQAA